jgi:hypothetical protein
MFGSHTGVEYDLLCKYCVIQGSSFEAVFQYLLLNGTDITIIDLFITYSMNYPNLCDIDFGKYNSRMLKSLISNNRLDRPLFDKLCTGLHCEEKNNFNILLRLNIKYMINIGEYLTPAGNEKFAFLSSYYCV